MTMVLEKNATKRFVQSSILSPFLGLDVLFEAYRQVREELKDYAVDIVTHQVQCFIFQLLVVKSQPNSTFSGTKD